MTTQPLVDLALYDPALKLDGTATGVDKISYSKFADLNAPNIFQLIACFEPDFWLLDGSIKLLPADTTNVHAGWVTNSIADGSGNFATPPAPALTVQFSTAHDLEGLTLIFSELTGEWATSVHVDFYDNADALIEDHTYTPTSAEFYVVQAVAGVRRIGLVFNSVNKANHRLRLKSIDYGKVVHFTGTDIKSCTVIEEIDPLATTLPIGTLDLTIHSEDAQFSIVNPTGDFFDLQNRQPLDVYERVGADDVYIGHFFLDEWENLSETEIRFRAVDWIGVLDSMTYLGDWWDNGDYTFATLMAAVLGAANIPYTLDGEIDDEAPFGFVLAGNYRTFLQYILAFAGGTAICARSASIHLKRLHFPPTTPAPNYPFYEATTQDYHLTVAEKGSEQSLSLRPLVTGIELTGWTTFEVEAGLTEAYNGILSAGTYTIVYDRPTDPPVATISGATFTTNENTYCVINVAVTGTVVINVKYFLSRKSLISSYNTADPKIQPHVLTMTQNTLMRRAYTEVANRWRGYFNMRYLQKMKAYAPPYTVGNSLLVDTQDGRQFWGIVTKMTLDLSGGFVARAEAVGIIKAL